MSPRFTKVIFCAIATLAIVFGACKKSEAPKVQSQQPPPLQINSQPPVQAPTPSATPSAMPPPATPVKCDFEWIDTKNKPDVWSNVSSAFRKELLPDAPSNEPGPYFYTVKRMSKVARCGNAVFVALEMRSGDQKEQEWNRQFQLYNFDLLTKEKSEIKAKWPFYLLHFRKLAHFEGNGAPDITFESSDCLECESQIILSAARVSPTDKKWELRPWLKGEQGIDVEDTDVGIDGSVEDYATLYGIADFMNEGNDQVALWVHYQELDEKDATKKLLPVTTMTLYGYRNGEAFENDVKDEVQIGRIKNLLCVVNPKDRACRKPKPAPDLKAQ